MQYLRPIPTLEDARGFLHDAQGLPHTIDGRKRTQTYLKAAVVFCWLALEEVVKIKVDEYDKIAQAPKAPSKLHDRMVFCVAVRYARKTSVEFLQNSNGVTIWQDEATKQLVEDRAFNPRIFALSTDYAKKHITFDEFWTYRNLRNDIVHINTKQLRLTLEQAKLSIQYCTTSIEGITGYAYGC
jgi:hypothetical protein